MSTAARGILLIFICPMLMTVTFVVLGCSSIQRKADTTDEKCHLVRGCMLLGTGDFRLNQHHPYLFNAIHALPTLFDDDFRSPSTGSQNWRHAKKDALAAQLVELNGGRIRFSEGALKGPRILALLINAAFVPVFYHIVARLFSMPAAILVTPLLALNPTFLAHGRLVTTDVPAMITIFLASLALYCCLLEGHDAHSRTKYYLLFIAASSVAFLTKYTAIVVAPVFVLLLIYREVRIHSRAATRLASAARISISTVLLWIVVLTAAYGFQFTSISDMDYEDEQRLEDAARFIASVRDVFGAPVADTLAALNANARLPFPQFIHGFTDNVLAHNYYGHGSFLLGEFGQGGWIHYFPTAFLLKETISFILLTFAAVGWGLWKLCRLRRLPDPKDLAFIVPAVFLLVLSLLSSINLGIRHILPIYPFVLILIAAMADDLSRRIRARYYWCAGAVIIGVAVVSVVNQFPHYIGYFNELVDSPENGYVYLRDSNFDWGQNETYVNRYVENRAVTIHRKLDEMAGEGYLIIAKHTLFRDPRKMSRRLRAFNQLVSDGTMKPIDRIANTHLVFLTDTRVLDTIIDE